MYYGCSNMMSGICFKRFQEGRKERRKKGRKGCWVGTVKQDWPNADTFLQLSAGYTVVHCTIVSVFPADFSIMKSSEISWFPSLPYFPFFSPQIHFFSLCGNDWRWGWGHLFLSLWFSLLCLPVFGALLTSFFNREPLLGE